MTKLPDDVVREIEKAFTEKYCVPKYSANDGWKMYLEGAEFGFKLSQSELKTRDQAIELARETLYKLLNSDVLKNAEFYEYSEAVLNANQVLTAMDNLLKGQK